MEIILSIIIEKIIIGKSVCSVFVPPKLSNQVAEELKEGCVI